MRRILLITGILLSQFVGTSMIPLSSGLLINNHLLSPDFHLSSIQEDIIAKRASPFADRSLDNGKKITLYTIEVKGYGHGVFFPPRKTYGVIFPVKTRDFLFCFVGVITLSGLFNDGHVTVNDKTYSTPLLLFFTGPTLGFYDDYPIERDYIDTIGFSFHRPFILSLG